MYCKWLTTITIPSNVKTIGGSALATRASEKTTIIMKPTNPPTIQSNTINNSYLNKIIVPKGCLEAYQTATNWSSFADYMEEATE
jgi:hypothetical protein